jgi:hypothetical protein
MPAQIERLTTASPRTGFFHGAEKPAGQAKTLAGVENRGPEHGKSAKIATAYHGSGPLSDGGNLFDMIDVYRNRYEIL